MSENISIKVDGTATTVGVDRLRTDKEGGGTVEWMPESELKEAAGLRVWRNGEYAASSFDVDGFDVVEVGLTARGGAGAELTSVPRKLLAEGATPVIAEGGKVYAMGGAQRVEVAKSVGGTLTLVPVVSAELDDLSVTQNGTYRAANSGLYAYDSVDVDISGGIGIEPPDSIRITTLPVKLIYDEGETINFTGMVVKAYKNGEIWTGDGEYPGGVIPFGELTLPKTTVEAIKNAGEATINYSGLSLLLLCGNTYGRPWGYDVMKSSYVVGTVTDGGRTYDVTTGVYGTEVRFYFLTKYWDIDDPDPENWTTTLYLMQADGGRPISSLRGESFVSYDIGFTGRTGTEFVTRDITDEESRWSAVPYSREDPVSVDFTVDDMIVPVQWKRPIDGNMLEDDFKITVNAE